MTIKMITGDCRDVLKTLATESVHCAVCSPPYWGLRDYGVAEQIGLEPDFRAYVAAMVVVFREVRRVLRKDGTLWLNLGDSYCSTDKWGGGGKGNSGKHVVADDGSVPSWAVRERKQPQTGLKPKDLCGIPWRVAFALQEPDYLGRIRNETDRAWLAALIDGEGCISILETTSGRESGPVSTSYPPILQVRMCDREMIDRAMALVGSNGESPAQYPPSLGGVRPAYQWRIHGRKAVDTIAEIYPFLLIKRKQAIIAWNHQAAREGYETKRGVRVPVDAVEKQKLCRDLIQRINQKETVDLPSWMVEPPQPIGPGWYLRQDLIWAKPNPMPESVTDRCTKAHEYIFLLSKSERYYYDAEAIAEAVTQSTIDRVSQPTLAQQEGSWRVPGKTNGSMKAVDHGPTRNKRSVWEVTTQSFSEAHFATFPPALIEPCIKAGTSEKGCCGKCGAPWRQQIEREANDGWSSKYAAQQNKWLPGQGGIRGKRVDGADNPAHIISSNWAPSCKCAADVVSCTVLDPFAGAGTTGLVADRLQRNAILIELNPDYSAMSERRIVGDAPLFADVAISRDALEPKP